jgi:eukaryotic-like serine/threonine-protein kinase
MRSGSGAGRHAESSQARQRALPYTTAMFPQIFGKYVLEREIAAGGMARVYLATLRGAVGFEKRLVVKQIRPELASDEAFVRRFVEEAKTAVELAHPNIVPVYELGVEQGVYYIAMELCEGATLAEILAETGPLPAEEGAYVGIEICRALDYAHRRAGIVHRDVTPRNVMIDEEGAVRLIDFGIAAPVSRETELSGSGRREIFGSPGHMPPEQLRGEQLTPAADVFAVGALLIEAWTGKPPFRRATPKDSEAALKQPLEPLDVEHERLGPLAKLLASSVALDPGERPERAETLARPLRAFVKSADLGDVAHRLGERVRRTRRRARSSNPWLLQDELEDAAPGSDRDVGATPPAEAGSVTRTFAAREDMVEWTRKLPSVPPGPLETPPAPAEPSAASRPSERVRASDAETSPTTTGARRERSSNGWRIGVALGATAVAAAILGARWIGQPRTPPQPKTSDASPSSAPSAAPRSTNDAPRQSTKPTPPPRPSATTNEHHDPIAKSETSARAAPSAAQGTLNLTADPPASVTVGSRSYAHTPVIGLELPSGNYTVTFKALGVLDEHVSARVTLKPGQTRGVHADFTSASARIILR